MAMFAALVFISVTLISIYYYINRIKLAKFHKFFEGIPTPPTVPFFGHVLEFTSTAAFMNTIHKFTKDHGNMLHLRAGPFGHGLIVSDLKFLEFLFNSNKTLKKSLNLRYLKPWLGDGLVLSDGGPKWKTHRRLITPAFHFKILEQFVDVFESNGKVLVEKLSKMTKEKSFDVYPFISRCTLDIICESAMGTKSDVQNNEDSAYFNSVKHMCQIFAVRTMSPWLGSNLIFKFTKYFPIQKKALKILHSRTNELIEKKRQALQNKHQEQDKESDDLGIKKKKAFLDLILEASINDQPLTQEEIREEVDTFMFGGHDTTATASSFILYCLAQNQEVQKQVFVEQKEIFGNNLKDAPVTYSTLQEMKYLDCVIKEGLRLYSPVPFYGRCVTEDVDYQGKILPKGLNILIFAMGVHLNPENYPNPEKFDPRRFEKSDGRSPYAFIPFSAGARNCIGQKYAMLEMKSLISIIVRNFEVIPAFPTHVMDLTAETVLKSLNGVKIGLKLR